MVAHIWLQRYEVRLLKLELSDDEILSGEDIAQKATRFYILTAGEDRAGFI
jgi:hypothetical protein